MRRRGARRKRGSRPGIERSPGLACRGGGLRLLAFSGLLWSLAAASASVSGGDFHEPIRVGSIGDSRIQELSGMVPVTLHENHYWIHNDSEHGETIFAVRQDGTIIAEVAVTGATNSDWEDVALGPGPAPGETYLYIADVGDNALSRDELAIYRIPEPQLPHLEAGQHLASAPAVKISCRYPEGRFDAEALVADPEGGDLYLITKVSGSAGVYRLPSSEPGAEPQTLVRLGDIWTSSPVTAADVAPDGRVLLVRTYEQVLEFSRPEGRPFGDIFFQARRVLPSSSAESKSESICFAHRSPDFLTSSEGHPAPIHRTYGRAPQPVCDFALDEESSLRFVRGDVHQEADDAPGEVDVADAVAIVDLLRGDLDLLCQDRADVDDSGDLGMDDLTALLSHLARGVRLASPFPSRGFDPSPDALVCFEEDPRRLLEEGDLWRYWHGAPAPGAGWQAPGFGAAGWPEGPGGVGFGSVELGTLPDGQPGDALTLYARTRFAVNDPGDGNALVLELDYDDGFVAYLNGTEVARRNLGSSGFTLPPDFPASLHSGGSFESIFLCPQALRSGDNVLALEVHNRSLADSSLFFRAGLRLFSIPEAPPGASPPPGAPAARLFMRAATPPNVGDSGVIRVVAEVGFPLRGASLSFRFDPSTLGVRRVTAAEGLRGGIWEDFSVKPLSGEVAYVMVVHPDAADGGAPLAGEAVELADIEYVVTAASGGETSLTFDERTGVLPLRNLLVADGPRSVDAEVEDFVVAVTDHLRPVIIDILNHRGRAGSPFFVVGVRFDMPGLSVRVCGREAEFELLGDRQTVVVTAPECEVSGFVPLEVCTDAGCAREEEGFFYLPPRPSWIRGDANGDGVLDISDPVALLGELFLGAPANPACPEALDANADGGNDLSDAVFLLSFLFLGGETIPPPFPEPAACS